MFCTPPRTAHLVCAIRSPKLQNCRTQARLRHSGAKKIPRRYLDRLSTGSRDKETNPSMLPDRLSTEQRDNLKNKNDTLG